MKAKQKSFTLVNVTWGTQVLVCAGGEYAQAEAMFIRRWKPVIEMGPSPSPTAVGVNGYFIYRPQLSACALWFKEAKPKLGIVVHESLHATFHVMREKGLSLTPESEEAFTYFHEWLVRGIAARLW